MRYINDKYLTDDVNDAKIHLKEMLKDALDSIEEDGRNNNDDVNYFDVLDTYNVIVDFCNIHNIDTKILVESIEQGNGESADTLYVELRGFFVNFLKSSPNMYSGVFAKKLYSFTDNEHESIQNKINKLRDNILNTDLIDEEHKARVLEKLEALQKELHKKMSTFDKVLGRMISIAQTLGHSAKEAKPMTDIALDILDTTLNAQARSEKLPDNKRIATKDILQIKNSVD